MNYGLDACVHAYICIQIMGHTWIYKYPLTTTQTYAFMHGQSNPHIKLRIYIKETKKKKKNTPKDVHVINSHLSLFSLMTMTAIGRVVKNKRPEGKSIKGVKGRRANTSQLN